LRVKNGTDKGSRRKIYKQRIGIVPEKKPIYKEEKEKDIDS